MQIRLFLFIALATFLVLTGCATPEMKQKRATRQVMEEGRWMRPSPYDPAGYPITRALIEEGRGWNIMDAEIPVDVPVRILHGGLDEDVPWSHSQQLMNKLRAKDVVWTLIKDGDHRLSRPHDIERMVDVSLSTCVLVDG